MMDEIRVKLSTNFMKKIVSKLITRYIFKQFGYKVNIQIDDLDVWSIGGDTTIRLNVEAKLDNKEFNQIMKKIDR